MTKTWIDKKLMCENTRSLSELKAIGSWVIWLEKSSCNGKRRSVLLGYDAQNGSANNLSILIPDNAEVGSSVHEYGGGSWGGWIDNKQLNLIYVDAKRGGVYHLVNNQEVQIAPAEGPLGERYFYADFDKSKQEDFVVCIRETRFTDHTEKSEILKIDLSSKVLSVLEKDADFYAFPRLSADSKKIAWVEWNNPHMPWDKSHVHLADLTTNKKLVIPVEPGEYVTTEPLWNNSKLWFLSEQDITMRPVCYDLAANQISLLPALKEEVGLPLWQLDQRSYLPLDGQEILVKLSEKGRYRLKIFTTENGWTNIEGVFPEFIPNKLDDGSFVAINASEDSPKEIIHFQIKNNEAVDIKTVRKSNPQWTSEMSQKVVKAEFLKVAGQDSYGKPLTALFYAATDTHSDLNGSMLIRIHGGPTAQCNAACDPDVQFWTSRGIAVLDVNYRGSTGCGREFRDALAGQWGVADVEDCIKATEYAVDQGLASKDKCFIRGSSAGGFTVLSALAQNPSMFKAGCVRYGVSDLSDLVRSSHRFEAHYTDRLIAPFKGNEDLYKQRSPITWAEKIKSPVLLLHGMNDRVVPKEQTEELAKKLTNSFEVYYDGEGHGFRNPENRFDALEREYLFYKEHSAS